MCRLIACAAARTAPSTVSGERRARATSAITLIRVARRSDSSRSAVPRSAAATCSASVRMSSASEASNWSARRSDRPITASQRRPTSTGVASIDSYPAAAHAPPASARCDLPSSAWVPVRTTSPITPESSGCDETVTLSRPRVIVHMRCVPSRWSATAVHTAV